MSVIEFVLQNINTISTAIQLVEALFKDPSSGAVKKEAISATIVALAKKLGVNIDANIIDVVIEILLFWLKATGKIK